MQGLVEDIAKAGGILTEQDLQDAQPEIKPAITAQIWGLDLITVPPPSSGAVLIAALQILQGACATNSSCCTTTVIAACKLALRTLEHDWPSLWRIKYGCMTFKSTETAGVPEKVETFLQSLLCDLCLVSSFSLAAVRLMAFKSCTMSKKSSLLG